MATCLNFSSVKNRALRNNLANQIETHSPMLDSGSIAEFVLNRNNGNPITLNPNGIKSEAYEKLQTYFKPKDALFARLNMFTDKFIGNMGNWIETGVEPSVVEIQPTSTGLYIGDNIRLYKNKTVSKTDLEKSEMNKENEDMLKCFGYAENGMRSSFTKGNMWHLRDVITGPSHANGGVDLNISKSGVSFDRKGTKIKAEEGLVISNPNELGIVSATPVNAQLAAFAGITNSALTIKDASNIVRNNPNRFNKKENAISQGGIVKPITNLSDVQEVNTEATISAEPNIVDYTSRVEEGEGFIRNCETEHCSAYVQKKAHKSIAPQMGLQDFRTTFGMKGDAWEVGGAMLEAGGSLVEGLENVRAGDIINLFGNHSEYLNEAKRDGEGNTHIGMIDRVDEDGTVWVVHNAHKRNPDYVKGGDNPKYIGREYRHKLNTETGQLIGKNYRAGNVYRIDNKKIKK